jgi:hypothetical protein
MSLCFHYVDTGTPIDPPRRRYTPDVERACYAMQFSPDLRRQQRDMNAVDPKGQVHAKLEAGCVYTWDTRFRRWQLWQPEMEGLRP